MILSPSPPPDLPPTHSLNGLGVYVHFPWCLKKCPYCDFLSIAVRSPDDGREATRAEATALLPHDAYADAVIVELNSRMRHLSAGECKRPPLRSIFFGGGTPSLWSPSALGRVIAAILEAFDVSFADRPEITVECNPTSVDENHFAALRDVGVNRVSIGVQSLASERLQFLGRLHDKNQAISAVLAARSAGIEKVSADIIYGIFRQAPVDAEREVEQLAQLKLDHLSAYMLTIEENTRFGALHRRGKLPLLDDVLVAQSYELVSEKLESLGFEHYEVSNFAQQGARSIHNDGYWIGRDYLGLGTGAYGTVSLPAFRTRYRNFISAERYLSSWTEDRPDTDPFDSLSVEQEVIDGATAVQEALLLGLRRKEGIDIHEVARVRGAADPLLGRAKIVGKLVEMGKLKQEGNRLKIPHRYWLFADQIIRDLI